MMHDERNPFGHPGPGPQAPPTLPGASRRNVTIPDDPSVTWFVGEGWRLLWSDWGLIAGAWLLVWFGGLILGFVPLVGWLSGVFVGPLYVAAGYLAVRKWRGESPRVGDLFNLREKYWPLVLQQLLVMLLLAVPYIPCALALLAVWVAAGVTSQGQGALPAGVLTVAIVATVLVALATLAGAVYLSVRVGFAGYLYIDAPANTLSSIDAIAKSWRLTREPSVKLFGVGLLLVGAMLASLLLLVIGGLLIGMPFAVATMAVCYAVICPRIDDFRYCSSCGYDMIHAPGGQCPECGAVMQPPPIPSA